MSVRWPMLLSLLIVGSCEGVALGQFRTLPFSLGPTQPQTYTYFTPNIPYQPFTTTAYPIPPLLPFFGGGPFVNPLNSGAGYGNYSYAPPPPAPRPVQA